MKRRNFLKSVFVCVTARDTSNRKYAKIANFAWHPAAMHGLPVNPDVTFIDFSISSTGFYPIKAHP